MKIRQKLINFSLLTCTTITPIISLTSCSTISQYCVPILTNLNPFENGFNNSNDNFELIDPYLTYARDKNDNPLDKELTNIFSYLPTKYIYTSAFDNSFKLGINKFYSYNGYSSFDVNWSNNQKDLPYQIDTKTYYDKQWLATSDKNSSYLNSSHKINSYQNLINYACSNAINSVSFNFLTLLNYMNNFTNKIIDQTDTNKVNELLDNVFTHSYSNFNHGKKEGTQDEWTQNYDFYQFCYNNANLISSGDSQYKFGPYSLDWTQEYSGVDKGLNLENNTPFIKLQSFDLRNDLTHPFDINNEKNKSLQYILPINTAFTGTYTYDNVNKKYIWNKATSMSPYCIYTYDANDKKHEQDPTGIIGIANIPTLIHLSSVSSNYYNPTIKSNSINPNEWLISNDKIDNINKQIFKNKVWNNITKHVKIDKPQIDSVSFKQKFIERGISDNINYDDWKSNEFDQKNIDPTIKYWCDNKLIQPGDFIALAQYSLMDISFKYFDTNNNEVNFLTKMPYFNGFSAVVPAYFAFNLDYYSPIDNIKENDDHMILNFSQDSQMYEDWSNIIKTLAQLKTPQIDQTKYETSFDAFFNDPYMIFRWMFGGYLDNGESIVFTNSQSINSNNIYFNCK